MAKVAPALESFNSGELSPLLAGRPSLKYYPNGCRRMRNFIPARQGPARRRPGTRFVAEVKDSSDRTWLGTFQFNVEQAYILEFGDQYIRFFSDHAVVGSPFEVSTPWTAADLTNDDGTFALRFVQSGEDMYIVHRDYAPRKLTRTGAASFSLSTVTFEGGPFADENDTSTTMYASAATGAGVTLTASSAVFTSAMIGSLVYLKQKDVDAIKQWEPGKSITAGDVRRSDGKNYTANNTATTGSVTPTHSVGAAYDGDAGVQWQFNDPGYGWAQITGYTSTTVVTVTVLSRIPDGAVGSGNATTRWALGAWNDVDGYPDVVTFYKERLCFARDQKLWLSVAGDFENFKDRDDGGLVVADAAITLDITSDRANRIEWLAPSDTALVVGTAGDEHSVSEITNADPLGPGNARARKQSEYGSRRVPICRVGEGIIFVQKAGRKVREMAYSWESEGFNSRDVTVLAEHITKGGVIDVAYQQEPDSVVWAVRSDGILLGLTLDREQEIRGWHPHRLGGEFQGGFAIVEAIASIPAPDGDRDELWMIVKRTINGNTKRYIEWMEYHDEDGDDPDDAFYVDCGLTLDNAPAATLTPGTGADTADTEGVTFTAGSAVFSAGDVGKRLKYTFPTVDDEGVITWERAIALITGYTSTTVVTCTIEAPFPSTTAIASGDWRRTTTSVSGASHLAGETVSVLGDGAVQPDVTVSGGGTVTLTYAASKAQIGLPYTSVLQPMPVEAGAQDGTAQGKTKRVSRCIFRFNRTGGGKYGRGETSDLDQISVRDPSMAMGEAPPLFTGDVIVSWPDGYSRDGLIAYVQDKPLPATVCAIMPQLQTNDDA